MTKPKSIYCLAEGKPLSAGRKKNECRNERYPVGVESESLGRAEIRFFRMREAGDHTQDRELKAQWLAEYGKDKVFAVFDDRASVVEMWRSE